MHTCDSDDHPIRAVLSMSMDPRFLDVQHHLSWSSARLKTRAAERIATVYPSTSPHPRDGDGSSPLTLSHVYSFPRTWRMPHERQNEAKRGARTLILRGSDLMPQDISVENTNCSAAHWTLDAICSRKYPLMWIRSLGLSTLWMNWKLEERTAGDHPRTPTPPGNFERADSPIQIQSSP